MGCGEAVKRGRTFVNKEHQLEWMVSGGASEMNALQPIEDKAKGGAISGRAAADSRRLKDMAELGAQKSREIADYFRARKATNP